MPKKIKTNVELIKSIVYNEVGFIFKNKLATHEFEFWHEVGFLSEGLFFVYKSSRSLNPDVTEILPAIPNMSPMRDPPRKKRKSSIPS